ncbi:MAG: hypothetical protein QOE02_281 [Rhodospirillaceae bacterium]|jgi:hypothetical protein|nr:hypothetical protein [Rhodospirillaceae bacterium]MEA3007991.1 hypothetical protein [Acidobacteriaceae bacterium]
MVEQHPVSALPWYSRADYPTLLRLFCDPDKLPATYDAWLERADQVEKQLQRVGLAVARIRICPVPFAAWCKERNISPDQAGRLTFANESARNLAARC